MSSSTALPSTRRWVRIAGLAMAGVLLFDAGPAALATAAQQSAPAKAPRTFGVKPSGATAASPDSRGRFTYTATPGAVAADHVAISNDALTPVQLSLYASDGFNTNSGGYDLLPASRKPVDVGSWVKLGAGAVTVKPGGVAIVPFTLTIPAKATPGDHSGGIVASLRTTRVDAKGNKVFVDNRVGVRMYVRVQGPLDPRLTISELKAHYHGTWNPFSRGQVTVSYVVNNVGNVRLGAHQEVRVSGLGGTVTGPAIPDIGSLEVGNAHAEHIRLRSAPAGLSDKVRVTVRPFRLPGDTDPRLTDVTATVRVPAVPLARLLLLALVIVVVLGAWWLRRRGRGAPTAAPGSPAKDTQPTAGAAS